MRFKCEYCDAITRGDRCANCGAARYNHGVSDAQYDAYKGMMKNMEARLARAMLLNGITLFEGEVPADFRSPNEAKRKGDQWDLPGR